MYKYISIFIMILCFSSTTFSEQIQLPSGNYLTIDNLSREEISRAIALDRKANNKNIIESESIKETVTEAVNNIDPTKLDEWRKLITGTIKDICNDLNVTVNDFVKTPVGLGISALIIYKVAGKEILSDAMDVIIMVPLWILTTGVILYISWFCFSYRIVYQTITYNEKGKKIKTDPERMTRYNWDSHDKINSAKTCVLSWLLIVEFVVTFFTLSFVLG